MALTKVTNDLQDALAAAQPTITSVGTLTGLTVSGDVTLADGADIITASAGTSNFRAGVNAGNSIVSGGEYNVVVGDEAGTALTTGNSNTLVGFQSGDALTDGHNNTAIGQDALGSDTLGKASVAIGRAALGVQNFTSATNAYNTAVGNSAGAAVTTGTINTLIGGLAGDALTIGNSNVAVGYNSLTTEVAGDRITAIGVGALALQTNASTVDVYNTAMGYNAGAAVTTATNNTFLGAKGGGGVTTGGNNTCLGYNAGSHTTNLITGSNNTILGSYAHTSTTSAMYANVIGHNVSGASSYTTIGVMSSDIRAAHGNVTWATVSDERYKKDIVNSTAGLSFINALQPRTFKYKTLGELPETFDAYEEGSTEVFKNSDTNHGFIAQEVKAAIDADDSIKDGFRLWDDRDDGSQEVAEAALIPVLVKAIQELTARIETLEG